jgi:hypothetical protein
MHQKFVVIVAMIVLVAGFAAAQSADQDPAVREAREKTAVIFDLGRVFGFIRTMENEEDDLALSSDQIRRLYVIMTAVRQSERIEPDQADEWLVAIEDEILTPAQLAFVDKLYLARSRSSGTGEGTGTGSANSASGTASGSIATYVAGGKFNPIVDTSKSMGEDFAAYYEELGGRR